MRDMYINRIIIKHDLMDSVSSLEKNLYQRQVDRHIIKFLLMVVIYSLLLLHGSKPLDFLLRLNLSGKWKVRETEEYVILKNSVWVIQLHILHNLYKVFNEKCYFRDKYYRKSFLWKMDGLFFLDNRNNYKSQVQTTDLHMSLQIYFGFTTHCFK